MPISQQIAASTEQNACTSPLQQLFNNFNNWAKHTTAWFPLHSHLFLDSTNLQRLLLLSLLPHPPTHKYNAQSPVLRALSGVIVTQEVEVDEVN